MVLQRKQQSAYLVEKMAASFYTEVDCFLVLSIAGKLAVNRVVDIYDLSPFYRWRIWDLVSLVIYPLVIDS